MSSQKVVAYALTTADVYFLCGCSSEGLAANCRWSWNPFYENDHRQISEIILNKTINIDKGRKERNDVGQVTVFCAPIIEIPWLINPNIT